MAEQTWYTIELTFHITSPNEKWKILSEKNKVKPRGQLMEHNQRKLFYITEYGNSNQEFFYWNFIFLYKRAIEYYFTKLGGNVPFHFLRCFNATWIS